MKNLFSWLHKKYLTTIKKHDINKELIDTYKLIWMYDDAAMLYSKMINSNYTPIYEWLEFAKGVHVQWNQKFAIETLEALQQFIPDLTLNKMMKVINTMFSIDAMVSEYEW